MTWMPSTDLYCLITKKEVHKQFIASMSWIAVIWNHTQGRTWIRLSADRYSARTRQKITLFSGHYLRNRSTLDIGVLGYIGVLEHKEHPPEVWHIPPGTPVYILYTKLKNVSCAVNFFTFCYRIRWRCRCVCVCGGGDVYTGIYNGIILYGNCC